VEPLPSFIQDAQPEPSLAWTHTPSTDLPDEHETCPVISRLPDAGGAGGVLVGAGGGGVVGGAADWAVKVVLPVVGVGSGGAPGSVDLADEGAGTAALDGAPPAGTYDGCVRPGAAGFPAPGVPGRAEGEAEGVALDWRERALRFAGPDAFVGLPDAVAPMATAAPAEITTAATTATT
jgi:hypothetical protein